MFSTVPNHLSTVRMHALDTLFSKPFSAVPNRFKYRNNACFRYIVFNYFSEVLNRFQYRHNICFRDVVFNIFSAVPNRFKYHQNACFIDIVSKMFTEVIRVVSNIVRLHALPCFQKCLCSSKISFQIASKCTIWPSKFQNYQMGWYTTSRPHLS